MSQKITAEQYKKSIEKICFDFFEYMYKNFPDLCENSMDIGEWDEQFMAFFEMMTEEE